MLLAYGGGSVKKNGVYDEVKALLKQADKQIIEFFRYSVPNPTYAKVQEGAAIAREQHVDFILAVGGGSVIDCCKVISAQALLDEDIWEMEYGSGRFPADGIPMGAVVTASGTGAEMNSGAVITCEDKNWKDRSLEAQQDLLFWIRIYGICSKMQVISGAFDTLSHAMETYLGHSDEDNVSDDVALAIMKNTVVNMRRLLADVNDMQARGNLMWDSAMAENGILKVGRLTDFQAHQMEHQLGAYTDCNHGQGLAVIHPAYYRHIVKDAETKFEKFGKEVFGVDAAEAAVEALADFIKECGLPTKMGELKSKVEITPEVLRKVADTCNIIKCGPRELGRDEIYDILMECM